MEISEYRNIFENERTHFYYVGTHNLFFQFVKRNLPKKTGNIILDAGCGTGALMKKMRSVGKIYGIDVSNEALKFAKSNGLKLLKKGSITNLPYKDNFFDAVYSVDVLYHKQVKSDLTALKEINRVLKPGGILIIKNPAHNWLRGSHDIVIHTKRRYSKAGLGRKLKKSGFEIVKISYVNIFFFPVAIAKRLFDTLFGGKPVSDVQTLPYSLNKLLINAYNLEINLLLKVNIPFGLSVFAIARKPVLLNSQ